ncbi:MAG: ATP-binding cassette domain-containing protein [Pirellulales bacterium]|nr:ATP-binding cassette domain-containing protein [Pirellulales bacterium]
MNDQPSAAIEVERLSFTYAGREQPAVRELSFRIRAGEWVVLAGATGSGKSTLLRALAGLIPHHSHGRMEGSVRLFGRDTRATSASELASTVGLVLQSPDDQLTSTSVAAEVAFGLVNLGLPTKEISAGIAAALAGVGLTQMADRSTAELSGGQKQRLIVASLLAMRPRVLLVDEPLSQLDPVAADELLSTFDELRAAGMTIVAVEHRLDEMFAKADRVLVLTDGGLLGEASPGDPALTTLFDKARLRLPDLPQVMHTLGKRPMPRVDDALAMLARRESRDSHDSYSRSNSDGAPRSNGKVLLSSKQLSFAYTRRGLPVLRDVSFDLRDGQRTALVGPNGAGKSTLLAVLAGLHRPTAGTIVCGDANASDNHVARDRDRSQRTSRPGLVLQNPDLMLFCDSVRDELALAPRERGLDERAVDIMIEQLAGQIGLANELDSAPLALSQGQRLRVAVAATLALDSPVLLLDEPTMGQDADQVDRLFAALPDDQIVLFATHDVRAITRHARRVLVLADGVLIADCTPAQLLADDELLAKARLRLPPLLELRRRLGLAGLTVEALSRELES